MSLIATERETGLFGVSFRVIEVLFALPALAVSAAYPVFAAAAHADDDARLARAVARTTEVCAAAGGALALGLALASKRRGFQGDRSAVVVGKIANDRESEPGSRRGLIGAHSALQHHIAHRGFQPGAVIIDQNCEVRRFQRRLDRHVFFRPFAGIVEKIAD